MIILALRNYVISFHANILTPEYIGLPYVKKGASLGLSYVKTM